MRKLNVLSIDWDYFINIGIEERLRLFPDGGNENLNQNIQDIIWGNRYMDDDLIKVKVDTKAVNKVRNFIASKVKKYSSSIQITDSHKYAYNFIMEHYKEHKNSYDGINLVNIDFHHDIYNMGEDSTVDCGNWFGKIMDEFSENSIYTWVLRKDSDDSIEDKYFNRLNRVYEDLSVLDRHTWDLIFICRSGMWSPPHLDKNFIKAFKWLLEVPTVTYQTNIFDTRYDEKFKSYVKGQKKMQELLERQWCGM